jgi:hypothetical protein
MDRAAPGGGVTKPCVLFEEGATIAAHGRHQLARRPNFSRSRR